MLARSTRRKGTAAISEESMTAWMGYIYEQQPKPNNATGVPVHLTAIDPNKNYQDIGIATSDALGNYAISWTPPVSGLYKVTATFEGSASYGGSAAGTSFLVSDSKAAPVVSPTLAPTSIPVTPTPIQSTSPLPTQAPPPASAPSVTLPPQVSMSILR